MSHPLKFPDEVPELVAEPIYLRALSEHDIPAWFERATDAESADLAGDPIPESIAAGTAWLQRHRQRFRERVSIRWSIAVAGVAQSVGTVGLKIACGERGAAELGIVVGRAHWGKGFGTTAARLAIRYGFETIGLTEVQAEVLQRNRASVRLLEKAGFRLLEVIPGEPDAPSDACFRYALRNPSGSAA